MDLQFSPFILPIAASACITAVLAIISWRNRNFGVSRPFTLLMAAATLWTLGSIGQLISADLLANYIFTIIEYPGIVTVPVAWFFIVLHYTGGDRYLTRKTIPLFFIIPAITILLVLTNPLHHLYYTGFTSVVDNGLVIWAFLHGPLFWIHVSYSYGLSLLGLALVITRLYAARDIYRHQMQLLLLACAIPVLANIVYVLSLGPVPGLDLTPLMFTLSGLIVAPGIVRFQLFVIMPVTYSRVFKTITDGVIVTDSRGCIVDINPAAEAILASPAGSLIARPLLEILPDTTRLSSVCGTVPFISHDEIILERGGSTGYYDTFCVPLDPDSTKEIGHLLILRDITRRKRAEIALDDANKKLSLMASITRHDILNQIMALNCYVELSATEATTPEQADYIEKEKKIISVIQEQIGFTREYQNLGVELPQWQDLVMVLERVLPLVERGKILVEIRLFSCEVYADPMFEKVFFNLISNAVVYGKTLTRITITGEVTGPDLLIICEDDGAGIPAEDKSRLFTRGFGKQTSLGLFLSQEILAITGLEIRETSEPGHGARFVIRVPGGSWRRSG